MAEFVVAATGSIPASRRFGDRFLDGDHTPTIQAAIDALPTAGGTVRILAGNYTLKRTDGKEYCVLVNKANVRLLFEPGAVLKLADNQFDGVAGRMFLCELSTGLTNVSFWGPGTLDWNKANNTGLSGATNNTIIYVNSLASDSAGPTRVTIGGGLSLINCFGDGLRCRATTTQPGSELFIDHLSIRNCGEGMLIQTYDDVRILNVVIDDIDKEDGLELMQCKNVVVTNCIITDVNQSAIDDLADNIGGARDNEFHTYSNCVLGPTRGSTAVVKIGDTPDADDCVHTSLIGCKVIMSGGSCTQGIRLGLDEFAGTGLTKHTLIAHTIIDGTGAAAGADGIAVRAEATHTFITGNLIHDCPGHAIEADDDPTPLHIVGNSGWDNTGGGISGAVGAVTADNNFV